MPNIANEKTQQTFVRAYLSNGSNARDAAIAAGYSPDIRPYRLERLLAHSGVRNLLDNGCCDMQGGQREAVKEGGFKQNFATDEEAEDIADMDVVKRFWTRVMADEDLPIDRRLKASELLAKTSEPLSDEGEEPRCFVKIIDNVRETDE